MLEIEFIVSLLITVTIVYFIRYKLNTKKKANEVMPLRQKDIKRKRKEEQKKLRKEELN